MKVSLVLLLEFAVVMARSAVQESVRKVLEGERPNPAPESVCMAQFQVNTNTIIRTKDSRSQGAKYLNETELPSKGDCFLWCCQVTSCNVAVFEEKDRGSCYLFDCGSQTDFKCTFTSHNQYTSAVLDTTQRKQITNWKSNDEHIEALKSLKSESAEEYFQPTNQPPPAAVTVTTQIPEIFQPNQPPTNIPSTPRSTTEKRCSQFQFECRTNSECIAIYNACDGIPQCTDGSDESSDLGCPPAGRRWLGPPEPAPSSGLGGPYPTGSDPNSEEHVHIDGWQHPSSTSNNENGRNPFYPHGANQPSSGIVDTNDSGHRMRPLEDVPEGNRGGKGHSRSSFNEGLGKWNGDVRPTPPPPLPPPPPPPKHDSTAIVQAVDAVDEGNRGGPRYHNVGEEGADGKTSWQQPNHGNGSPRHNNAGSVFSHKSNNLPDASVSMRSRPGAMSKLHHVAEDNENSGGYYDSNYNPAPREDSDAHYNGNENAAREYYESDVGSQKNPNSQPEPVPRYDDGYLPRQDGGKSGWTRLSGHEEYKAPSGSYRDYPQGVPEDKNQQARFQPSGRHVGGPPQGNPQWTDGKDRTEDYRKPKSGPDAVVGEKWHQDSNTRREPISKGQMDSAHWNDNHKAVPIENDHPQLGNNLDAVGDARVKQHMTGYLPNEHPRYVQPQAPTLPKGNQSIAGKEMINTAEEVTSTAHEPRAQKLSHGELNLSQIEIVDDSDNSSQSSGAAVLALTLGLSVTGLLLVLVGCRLRRVRRRMMRRGRSPYAHDADYLVNGMYL